MSFINVYALHPNQAALRLSWEKCSQNFSLGEQLYVNRILRLRTSFGHADDTVDCIMLRNWEHKIASFEEPLRRNK